MLTGNIGVWELAGAGGGARGDPADINRTGDGTAQTNWMLKIQFEGFAVRFIRSPRSLQAGLSHIQMETQLFCRNLEMFKCLSPANAPLVCLMEVGLFASQ